MRITSIFLFTIIIFGGLSCSNDDSLIHNKTKGILEKYPEPTVTITAHNHIPFLAKNILEGKENAVEKYVGFLKSGGSDYPIEILKKAGVDMTTSEPLQATIDRFNELLEMLEKEI